MSTIFPGSWLHAETLWDKCEFSDDDLILFFHQVFPMNSDKARRLVSEKKNKLAP